MRRSIYLIFLLALLSNDVRAQDIRLQLDDAPLREALLSLSSQTGIDFVFAESTVDDFRSTCTFVGQEYDAALDCILQQTGLRAERVRRRQFVIVSAPVGDGDTPPKRVTLAGFVLDAQSGDVLPGAHVYLPDLRVGTVTNEAGFFALPSLPEATYRARFTYVGFETRERLLTGRDDSLTISLKAATVPGGSIVVEDENAGSAGVAALPGFGSEALSILDALPTFPGESDLLQTLQWYPGVRRVGEFNGGMSIRGGSPDQNLYLIDGAPVYHPWHAFSLISTFQAETFDDFRLYRGAYPSRFGGRTSAILDARMKDGSRVEPRATIALSALSGRFVVETPATRNSSFMVAGRRSYLDKIVGREHPVEGADGRRDTLRTGYYFFDASAKYSWRASRRDKLSVSYYQGGDDLDLRLPFDLSLDFSSWLRPADRFFEVAHRWQNRLLSARFQRVHSDQTLVTATAYYSRYEATEGTYLRPMSSAALRSNYTVDVQDVGLRLDADYVYSLSHEFHLGGHIMMRDFASSLDATVRRSPGTIEDRKDVSSTREPEIAIYAEDIWTPTDHWTFRPGVRISSFGAGTYSDVSPSFSFQFAVHPTGLLLNAGVGRRVQYLHRLRDRQAYAYDLVSSRWVPAGAHVRPASAVDVSGGFESQPARGLMLRGDAYWRRMDHVLLPEDAFSTKEELVGPGIGLGDITGQYVEGQARAYGIELTARVQRGPWSFRLNYAGGKSLMRSNAAADPYFHPARYDVPRSMQGLIMRESKKWRFATAFELRSGYPASVPIARYVVGDPLDGEDEYLHRPYVNNGRLPPYVRADLSAVRRFKFIGADWQARLQVYNVTNRRNVIARQYLPTDSGMDVRNRRGLPLLPLIEIEMEL